MLRPFLLTARVSQHSYSLPLQRRITDFGADSAFGSVNQKLKEHYGIEVPVSGIRVITLRHAKALKAKQAQQLCCLEASPKACVISETDGSMVPIVKLGAGCKDRRKQKVLFYREARLTLAHEQGSASPVFSATLGDVKETGRHVLHCVKAVGANHATKVHCVGDGAVWIAHQIEEQFGAKGRYLVDFYHVCEYLSAAAPSCARDKACTWLAEQKDLLKASQAEDVLLNLHPYLEPPSIPDEEAPVRVCYRYMQNRLHQLDYKQAIENHLPIGSGEIESAHRYIIQERLKLAGAWWLEDNADSMLALRINRANDQWDQYWMAIAA